MIDEFLTCSNSPVIAVGITTFNRLEFLEETLISVLNQTYPNLRILVANDNPLRTIGWKDFTLLPDSRVEFINHRNNLGEIENLNWLMNYADTPYFTWLADDDLMHPRFLEIALNELSKMKSCKAVYSNFRVSRLSLSDFFELSAENVVSLTYNREEFLTQYSGQGVKLIGNYGVFDLRTLKKIGGIQRLGQGFSPWGDTLIPILISNLSDIKYIDLELILFRTHEGSMSASSHDINSYLTAEIDFLKFVTTSISSLNKKSKITIYSNFRQWFQENHFTVCKRISNKNLIKLFGFFLVSEAKNFFLFYSYKLGLKQDILFAKNFVIHIIREVVRFTCSKFSIKNRPYQY